MFYQTCLYHIFYHVLLLSLILCLILLLKDHNCCITFSPSHCILQDLRIGQTIGDGHKNNGLYILESTESQRVLWSVVDEAKALLWHPRLKHAPLQSHRSYSLLDIRNNFRNFLL